MILSSFHEAARRAHMGTSFSPERRADTYIADYSAELTSDLETLRAAGEKHGIDAARLADTLAWYESKYKRLFGAWMGAKGRVMSPMITGPARFPTARNNKFCNWERGHYETFTAWRDKALRVVVSRMKPRATVESEVVRYEKKLADLERMQELMKAVNKIIKAAKGADCTAKIIAAGLSEKDAIAIQKPDWCNRIGFPAYSLSNNNAMIRDVRGRLAVAKRKAEKVENGAPIRAIMIGNVNVVFNNALDRIQLIYPGKPEQYIINALKTEGFRWSPANVAWQRQLTVAGVHAAATMVGTDYVTLAKANQ